MKANTIQDKLAADNGELLDNFLKKEEKLEYIKFYSGKVIDNNDPEKIGRCKIRVYGIHDDTIPDNDLPWATPDFNFIGSTLGSFIVPPKDTIVKVYFENGNLYQPVYTTKILVKKSLPTSTLKDENYPDSMVFFETDQGEYFKVNRKTNVTTYHAANGAIIEIDNKGNITIDTGDTEEGNVKILSNKNGTAKIFIGDASDQNIIRGKEFLDWMNKFIQAFLAWVPISADGGLALKVALMTALTEFQTKYNIPANHTGAGFKSVHVVE